jgi:hypothetical protein
MRVHITTLCADCDQCPVISRDDSASPEKEIVLTDDFGSEVRMSRAQLSVFVEKAKAGDFESVAR